MLINDTGKKNRLNIITVLGNRSETKIRQGRVNEIRN
jgi:hypothetical protein